MTELPHKEQQRLIRSRRWYIAGYVLALIAIGFWIATTPSRLQPQAVAAGVAGVALLVELASFGFAGKRADIYLVTRYALVAAFAATLAPLLGGLWALVALSIGPIILLTLALGPGSGTVAALAAAGSLSLASLPQDVFETILSDMVILLGVPLGALLERYFQIETAPPKFSDLIGFENVMEGVIVTDALHRIFYINPAAAVTTRWSRDEAQGLPVASLLPLDSKDNQPLEAEIQKALESGQPQSIQGRLVSRIAPGRLLSVSISPLPEKRGAVILLRDVTEETEQGEHRLEFASTVSHELRTPLATISGYLELLARSKRLPEKEADQVEKAYDAARHVSRLLQRFLRATQIGQDQIKAVVVTPVPVEPLLTSIIEEFRLEAASKGLRMGRAGDPGGIPRPIPPVLADPDRLREVLENLVGNAIKFTERGSVTIGASEKDGHVDISVTDTGIGIKPEDQPHVFEQYYRAENKFTQTRGGAGLGLYVSRSLVESMGGSISLSSGEGGSTFTVTLPTAQSSLS